jgi:hypothetical protein
MLPALVINLILPFHVQEEKEKTTRYIPITNQILRYIHKFLSSADLFLLFIMDIPFFLLLIVMKINQQLIILSTVIPIGLGFILVKRGVRVILF